VRKGFKVPGAEKKLAQNLRSCAVGSTTKVSEARGELTQDNDMRGDCGTCGMK